METESPQVPKPATGPAAARAHSTVADPLFIATIGNAACHLHAEIPALVVAVDLVGRRALSFPAAVLLAETRPGVSACILLLLIVTKVSLAWSLARTDPDGPRRRLGLGRPDLSW